MAVNANKPCVDDARKEYEFCKAACNEQFLIDKDLCRNVNHECADTCRAEHSLCVEPFLEALDTCKDDCDGTLKAETGLVGVNLEREPQKEITVSTTPRLLALSAAIHAGKA